ncbi:Uncharacterised protein [Chlamydia trachomatis]|nr:Uncharacterised protein [Chlamydia trachomatis]
MAELEVHRPQASRILEDRIELDHRSIVPRPAPTRYLQYRSYRCRSCHHRVLHVLRFIRHGRRWHVLRIIIRHGLPPRYGHHRCDDSTVHAGRWLPCRVLDRRCSGHHDADRAHPSAGCGHHPRWGLLQSDERSEPHRSDDLLTHSR